MNTTYPRSILYFFLFYIYSVNLIVISFEVLVINEDEIVSTVADNHIHIWVSTFNIVDIHTRIDPLDISRTTDNIRRMVNINRIVKVTSSFDVFLI